MSYSTSFDGANNTLLSSLPSWVANTGFYEVLKLNGSGALKHDAYSDDGKTVLNPTGFTAHYVKAVVGAGFIAAEGGVRIAFGATNRGDCLTIHPGAAGVLVLGADGSGILGPISGAFLAAGDELEVQWNGPTGGIVVKLNGATVLTETLTTVRTGLSVGILPSYSGRAATDDLFRSWESGELGSGGGDTAAPVLTGLGLTATGPTTLTGDFDSDEAGEVTAVLFLASQADPSKAQVLAGLDVNGDPAIDFILDQAMTSGANELLFIGANPGTAYKYKAVARDAVPNEMATGTTSPSATTSAVSVSTVLYHEDGVTPAASVTGLSWGWWDTATPDFANGADASGTGESTDASGVFSTALTGSALGADATGTLLVYKTDGVPESLNTVVFCGPLNTVA